MDNNLIGSFERSINMNNKRAYKNNAVGNLTIEEFKTAFLYFDGKCAYSGRKIDNSEQISLEHIIPITSGGHSMAFNCIPVIKKYNTTKSAYHLLDWWRTYVDSGKVLYTPYRLLKVLNYMVKSLECINIEDKSNFILTPDKVDEYLKENEVDLNFSQNQLNSNKAFSKINQIEILSMLDLITIEESYCLYSNLDGLKLNTAIFFEEAMYVLANDVPSEIIDLIKFRISKIPDIYIDGKKVFKKDMDKKDIEIRHKVLAWTKKEAIENEFGIIGYIDFELLKKEENIERFLEAQKKHILDVMGANEIDFNNILNKVPNIITNVNLDKRVSDIEECFGISRVKTDKKSSEMYRYLVNKPDLLLAGKMMEVLLEYARLIDIDKRILKKGIPLNVIIDNIEVGMELLDIANLQIDDAVRKRILEKLINNSNGRLIREAYKELKNKVRGNNVKNGKLHRKSIDKSAARWILCISEKYNSSELFNDKKRDRTKSLYSNMSFDKEGYMVGVNRNAYIVPKIIRMANLNINRATEANIINDVFFLRRIKSGEKVDGIYEYLATIVRADNHDCDEEHIYQDAARWFVFFAENPHISLEVLFEKDRDKYIDITKKYYKDMKFDEEGNLINKNIPELMTETSDVSIGKEYMAIVDAFFNAKGEYYFIGSQKIKKEKLQKRLYTELSKCKNKRAVKNVCIKIRKEYSNRRRKTSGPNR